MTEEKKPTRIFGNVGNYIENYSPSTGTLNTIVGFQNQVITREEKERPDKNRKIEKKGELNSQEQLNNLEMISTLHLQIWENIHKDFNDVEIKIQWAECFTWTEVKQWFELITDLEPKQDLDFVLWLRDVKEKDCLNIDELRIEYQKHSSQTNSQKSKEQLISTSSQVGFYNDLWENIVNKETDEQQAQILQEPYGVLDSSRK